MPLQIVERLLVKMPGARRDRDRCTDEDDKHQRRMIRIRATDLPECPSRQSNDRQVNHVEAVANLSEIQKRLQLEELTRGAGESSPGSINQPHEENRPDRVLENGMCHPERDVQHAERRKTDDERRANP